MMFGCKHKWKVLSEKTTESYIEQVRRLGGSFKCKGDLSEELSRKYIQTLACDKCGKLRRFETKI
jgi:hypothetical protein